MNKRVCPKCFENWDIILIDWNKTQKTYFCCHCKNTFKIKIKPKK